MNAMPKFLRAVMALPQSALILLVKGYRLLLSPSLGASCRFEPSCSAYSLESLQRHGALAGTGLTLWRLVRCHPWCDGGHDPVPQKAFPLFSRLVTPVTDTSSEKKPS